MCLQLTNSPTGVPLRVAASSNPSNYSLKLTRYGRLVKRFRVNIVKIDGSFIKELHLQPLGRAIVRSRVDIARLLHVHTVAEHVDHPDILHWTQTLGVDDIQGYWLGRPLPLDELFRPVLQAPSAP